MIYICIMIYIYSLCQRVLAVLLVQILLPFVLSSVRHSLVFCMSFVYLSITKLFDKINNSIYTTESNNLDESGNLLFYLWLVSMIRWKDVNFRFNIFSNCIKIIIPLKWSLNYYCYYATVFCLNYYWYIVVVVVLVLVVVLLLLLLLLLLLYSNHCDFVNV